MSINDHDQDFDDFFRQHNRRLRGFLAKTVGAPPNIVDEAAPIAFLAVRRHWARLRDGAPKQYLFKVGRRKAVELMNAVRHRTELANTGSLDEASVGVRNHVDGLIDQLTLEQAIQQLSPCLRQAVTLRHVFRFSVIETATVMNVEPGTVKRYTHEGLQKLRDILAREIDAGKVEDR